MYLIDTNVLSELPKRSPNPGALSWLEAQPEFVISSITLEELYYGVERLKDELHKRRLEGWLASLMEASVLIIPFDTTLARVSGQMRARLESKGRILSHADALIAASALSTGRILVTRNSADFKYCGVSLLNPFT